MYRARLTHSQLTHVVFSPGGSCLAAAAAEECRVALLGLRGCEQVDTLGYFTTPGEVLTIRLRAVSLPDLCICAYACVLMQHLCCARHRCHLEPLTQL
jgi:hypothetical protein